MTRPPEYRSLHAILQYGGNNVRPYTSGYIAYYVRENNLLVVSN